MNLIEIGEKIKRARRAKRLTIHEVATALNMGVGTISRLESGAADDMMVASLMRLADHVGMTLVCQESGRPEFTLEMILAEHQNELVEQYGSNGPMG